MSNIRKTILDDYNNTITIHSSDDFISMRKAGELASKVLDFIEPHVKEGVTTEQLDSLCHEYILKKKLFQLL